MFFDNPAEAAMRAFRAEIRSKIEQFDFVIDMKIDRLKAEIGCEIEELRNKSSSNQSDVSVYCQNCFFRRVNDTLEYCVYPDNIIVWKFGIDSRKPTHKINKDHDCKWYKKKDD